MFEGGFEVFDDFLGEHIGIGEIVGLLEAFVADPEEVEACLVTVRSFIHLFKPNPNAFTITTTACLSSCREKDSRRLSSFFSLPHCYLYR